MPRRSRSTGKGPLWHGYRRPVWRDRVFWLAFVTSIAGLLVQNAFGNFEATGRGWAILGLEIVITFAVVFALVGVVASTFRGFGEGWRQAEQAAPPRGPQTKPTRVEPIVEPEPVVEPVPVVEPSPVVEPAPVAEPAPAPAPEAQPEPEPDPEPGGPDPEPSARPRAGVEMERQARRLGRAFAAGRRTYKKYDED